MKHPALLALLTSAACLTGGSLSAVEVVEPTPAPAVAKGKELLTPAQIDTLLAPVALYPDPLLAIILPASTFPADIVLAARYVRSGGDASSIDAQTWDDSVKALARYPDVLKWMDENLEWTQQVGTAFLLQPAEILTGTQRLRASAIAAGNLKDTPQQTVIVEREVVRIVPAQREVIYVPVYDPVLVYHAPVTTVAYHKPGVSISFSVGYPAGFWLSYYCNWGTRTVVIVDRPYRTVVWNRYPAWSCPPPAVVHCEPWRPSVVRVQTARRDYDRHDSRRAPVSTPNRYVFDGSAPSSPFRDNNDRNTTSSSDRSRPRASEPGRLNNHSDRFVSSGDRPSAAPSPAPSVKPSPDRRPEPVASRNENRRRDNDATSRGWRTPSAPVVNASPSPAPAASPSRPAAPVVTERRQPRASTPVVEASAERMDSPWSRRDRNGNPFGPKS